MNITPKQGHVLANINRVVPLAAKLGSKSARLRYQLDGIECTAQIIALTVLKLIGKHSGGGFRRLGSAKQRDDCIGERQAPLASSIEAIRASLSAPETIRSIGSSKRQRRVDAP